MSKNLIKSIKQHKYGNKFVPLVLLIITLFTYLPLISQLGFYWDDWTMLWFNYTQGSEGFRAMFASDRPFLAYLYNLTANIGVNPIYWQILSILGRFAVVLAFWYLLCELIPEHKEFALWTAVLAVIFPGFKQMPISYIWGNAWLMLLAFVLSFYGMVKAIKSRTKKHFILWTVFAILTSAFCTFSTEYYIGLELIRIPVIYIALSQREDFGSISKKRRIAETGKQWIPYILVLSVFLIWRVFIFKFPSYQPILLSEFEASPFRTILSICKRIVTDIYTAVWKSWTEAFRFPFMDNSEGLSLKLYYLFAAAGFILSFLTVKKYKSDPENDSDTRWLLHTLIIGLASLVLAGIPYWIPALEMTTEFPKDRFLAAFMLGSCITVVSVIFLCFRTKTIQTVVFCLFAAAAIGANLLNANSYRKDWMNQKNFVDQLQTRIPDFDGKTMLITGHNPLTYETDNSLTGLVNLIYAPDNHSLELPLIVSSYDVRFNNSTEELEQTDQRSESYRTAAEFNGDNSDILVYSYSPPGCLRILDQSQHGSLPVFPSSYYDIIPYSRLDNIKSVSDRDTRFAWFMFGPLNTDNWCYYFESADLKRQSNDWKGIAKLGDIASFYGYSAGEASENIVFIEGYANTGQWDKALPLITAASRMNKSLEKSLCPILQNLLKNNMPASSDMVMKITETFNSVGCSAFPD